MNTKINYVYHNVYGRRVDNTCVINGTLTDLEKEIIMSCLFEEDYFIPSKVGLPERRFDSNNRKTDKILFQFAEKPFEQTLLSADVKLMPTDLVLSFMRYKNNWA